MTANQFRAMKDRSGYLEACAQRENFGALQEIQAFEKYLDKEVRVVKGHGRFPSAPRERCSGLG